MEVWAQENPQMKITFGWEVAKDMCTQKGKTGSLIDLFMFDHFVLMWMISTVMWNG